MLRTSADLTLSSMTLEPPAYPSLNPRGKPLVYLSLETLLHPHRPPEGLPGDSPRCGLGFELLRLMNVRDEYVDTFKVLADYTNILCAYHEGILHVPGVVIADSRNVLQHRLLDLPTIKELPHSYGANLSGDSISPNLYAYEACRLAALIYGVMVTYPLPRSQHARGIALNALKELLGNVDLLSQGPHAAKLYFWCLVISSIGAYDNDDRAWFILQTKELVAALDIRSWDEAERNLHMFAWLKCACSVAGRALWAELSRD